MVSKLLALLFCLFALVFVNDWGGFLVVFINAVLASACTLLVFVTRGRMPKIAFFLVRTCAFQPVLARLTLLFATG